MSNLFPNLAGREDCDVTIAEELRLAGIPSFKSTRSREEVPASIFGGIDPLGWGFRRAWRYWVAQGPGLPPHIAEELHAKHGKECRVEGHCGAPSPLEWCHGFAVGSYHVDSQEALNALAKTIRSVPDRVGEITALRSRATELEKVLRDVQYQLHPGQDVYRCIGCGWRRGYCYIDCPIHAVLKGGHDAALPG